MTKKQKPGKSSVTKTYSYDIIQAVISDKKAHPKNSIRTIAKYHGIPKTVVGRWLKEPEKTLKIAEGEKIRDSLPKDLKTKKGKSSRKSVDEFLRTVVKTPKGNQAKLRIKRVEDLTEEEEDALQIGGDISGEGWIVISG